MADGKNGFLLYKDLEPTVAKLSNEEAGKLFKHLLQYVNDKEPTLDDRLLELVFEPIKQSLKRDLKKRDGIRKKRAEAGKLGGLAKLANASKGKQKLANVAVSVSDSVSDSVSVINNLTGWLELRTTASSKLEGRGVPGFSIPRKLTKDHEECINKLIKKGIDFEDYKIALQNYGNEILKRGDGSYKEHRFTFIEFLKQTNGVAKFI